MTIENINDGVGKKIVEALKMQSDEPTDDNMITEEEPEISESYTNEDEEYSNVDYDTDDFGENFENSNGMQTSSFIENEFNKNLIKNLGPSYMQETDDFDYPANVAVLKQLIAKLPAGVSKQTGALIIKQTMEALGISMNSVLQEAKQVQESLISNSKECQNNIIEYRKQIGILEAKAQQYQRQASIMNDIINLFIHTR